MDDFLGTWKLVKSVNYDEYLKAVGAVQREDDDVITDTLSEEEDQVVWKIVTTKQAMELRFTLDKEFQLDAPDGRHLLITVSLKGNQLVQVQKMDEIESTIIREVQGTNMTMTMKVDGVEAQRIYEMVVVPSSSNTTTKYYPGNYKSNSCALQ